MASIHSVSPLFLFQAPTCYKTDLSILSSSAGPDIGALGSCTLQVAGDIVSAAHLRKRRLNLGAHLFGMGTAGVKPAAWRWIEGTGHLSGQDDLLALYVGV